MATRARFIGKIPLPRALEVQRTRHGVSVKTQSIPKARELGPEARDVINKAIENIQGQVSGKLAKPNALDLEVARRKARILGAVREAGYRRMHASELLASLMDSAGLEKEKLLPYVNAARYLVRNGTLKIDGAASLNYYSGIVRADLLKRTRDILLHADKPLTTPEIAQRLGYGVGLSAKDRFGIISSLASCLGLLDLSRLVVKLPHAPGRDKGTEYYLWWAAEHRLRPETKPSENLRYRLMQALAQGPSTQLGLGSIFGLREKNVKGVKITKLRKFIASHLQFLADAGVVLKSGGNLAGLGGGATYTLTDFGRELLAEQQARDSITPRMRLVLLGEHSGSLTGKEKKQYEHFKRWATVIVEYAKSRQPKVLSRKHGVNPDTIIQWGSGKIMPFRQLSSIRANYLPRLARESPELAKEFAGWIETHRRYFKE